MMHVLVHAAREGSCRGEGVTQQETPGHFNTHKHKRTHKHKSSSRTHSHRWWWARRSRSETQRHRDTETQRLTDMQTHADTRRHKTPRHIHTCTRARNTHNAHAHVTHTSVQMMNVYFCNRGRVQRKIVMMHVLVHAAREGSCRGEGVTQQETPGHFNTHKHKHTHKHKSSSRTHSHRWWWARRSRWWRRWRRWR